MHLELHLNKIEFIYHSVTKKVKIKLDDQARVVLYKGIAELLGFEPGEYKKSMESSYIDDPTASFPIMYAYCDPVEPQIVGHIQAPLLKIIKVEGKYEEKKVVNALTIQDLTVIPVIRQQFQTIEIILRLHAGDFVSFERGRVIAVYIRITGHAQSRQRCCACANRWFKGLFRTALPFLKSGAKSERKEVLKTSTQIANDMLEGQSFPESASYKFFQIEESKRPRYFRSLGVMAFLLKESPECVKSELNLFLAPPTQTVIEKGQGCNFISLLMLQMKVLLNSSYLEVVMLS
ncbi:uncharacterized protein TNCV_4490411 [Trichonephila clavipes]|nr:uncharacterized protein TNCV_4490411 [Trichonephila clavipes]